MSHVGFAVPDRNAIRSQSLGLDAVGLDDGGDHLAEAGLQRDAHLQCVIGVNSGFLRPHVGESRVRLRAELGAADRELPDARAVDANLDLVRHVQAADHVGIGPAEPDLQDVLAIHREVVARRDAAARAQRKLFAEAVGLPQPRLLVRVALDGGVALERRPQRRDRRRRGARSSPPRSDSDRAAPAPSTARRRWCRSRRPARPAAASSVPSISTPSRSRTALAYSVRLSRWRSAGRPGFGCAAAARSSSVSSHAATAS